MLWQRYLGWLDLWMPAFLPLDGDRSGVAVCGEQGDHFRDRHLTGAEQHELPAVGVFWRSPGVLDLGEQQPAAEVAVDLGRPLPHPVRMVAIPDRTHPVRLD